MTSELRKAALKYHNYPTPGKVGMISTKSTDTQYDMALCYTPGVAEPVLEIEKDPQAAYLYTSKGNLVAVITNGTAVLGLGHVGALASKPVMEGKGVLFKRFADVDVFDIEVAAEDTQSFIETVVNISPTFGGINLEDIKAPECFVIEHELRNRLAIPVFHDDQHGTAIVVAAALLNALELQQKKLSEVVIVCAGAGAAGIATMNLLIKLGANRNNLLLIDRGGVIHSERDDLNFYKQAYAVQTKKRTLTDALEQADVFIGVSGPDLVKPSMLDPMRENAIVFALSNPIPEIMPDLAKAVRNDLIIATGRSDFPNQVNNALCFPYIFRGALDVRANRINEAMQLAAVHAIKDLARQPIIEEIKAIYFNDGLTEFGPNYILPKLLDPRLKSFVSSAVANAAIKSGVAQVADSQICHD